MNTAILIRLAACLAMVVVLVFGEQYIERRGYDRAQSEYTAAINAQKAQAAATLASETAKTRAAEQSLQTNLNAQNIKDADHAQTIATLSDRLHRAAGRLRDPYAAGCGAGSSGTTSETAAAANGGATDTAQAGGLLSAAATEFLLTIAREADDINTAYASCRADAFAVRGRP